MADTEQNAGGEEEFAAALRDIEHLLNDGDKQIQETIDKLPGPVYAVNYEGHYVYVNKVYAQLRGKSVHELAGKCCYEGTDAEKAFEKEREIMDGGEMSVTPLDVVVDSHGRQHPFMTYKIPMSAANSTKMLMVVSVDMGMLAQAQAAAEDTKGEKRPAEDDKGKEGEVERSEASEDAKEEKEEAHAIKKAKTDEH
eukprot:comp11793_c0_seq1/m.6403 comp11793_c0_seq1/g.6403  ORF comp11793_c0_seq1/g.6403 comp11793_c0_seq1/m.6403 type:complete len:196 (-) comp11793_c0_seq1:652-1239(-)